MPRPAAHSTAHGWRTGAAALAGAVFLVAVLTGCTTPSNTPEGYGETDADGVDIVRANFIEGCRAAGAEAEADNSTDCECLYQGIVDEIPFEEFQEIEDQLQDDPTDLPDRYIEIADRCVDGEVTAPTGGETTTTES